MLQGSSATTAAQQKLQTAWTKAMEFKVLEKLKCRKNQRRRYVILQNKSLVLMGKTHDRQVLVKSTSKTSRHVVH